jgi:putative ABC transport system permease protein
VPELVELGVPDLFLAAGLVLLAGVVSLLLRLGLQQRLAVAAVRTTVQLLLIGFLLEYVFALEAAWAVLLVMLVMISAATHAAITRPSRTFSGVGGRAFFSLFLTGFATTLVVTQVVVGVTPWYQPQYLIPLLGMVLGNSLNGISLCLDHLLELFRDRSDELEMELAHGAAAWEAARGPVAEAVRRGLIPTINSMSVVGLVSLPGMMTGQILAGAHPLGAVKYQIVVMFMLAGAVSFGAMLVALLTFRALFNEQHQLMRHRIRPRT